jgi:hypothetical protein
MSLFIAVRRARLSVSPGRGSCAVAGCAIRVTRLADQNQRRVLNWISGADYPGGVEILPTFPRETARPVAFCFGCETVNVRSWCKKVRRECPNDLLLT